MAWLVHVLTGSGALVAWLAIRATSAGHVREAFLWLTLSTVVDAVDGWLARRLEVKRRLPAIDGARLDDIVDYLTFVFVPAWMVTYWNLVPPRWEAPVAAAMLMASAYGFSRADAKTADHYFTGFPSYWNVVVLYLVALRVSPAASTTILLALAGLVFVPIAYVYPSRTRVWRPLTLSLGVLWTGACVAIVIGLPEPPPRLVWASLVYPVYYAVLSLVLNSRRQAMARASSD